MTSLTTVTAATSSTSAASGSSPPAPTTIDVVNPATEEVIGRIPAGHAGGRRPRRGGRPRGVPRPGRRRRRASAPSCCAAIADGLAERGRRARRAHRHRAGHAGRRWRGRSRSGCPSLTFALDAGAASRSSPWRGGDRQLARRARAGRRRRLRSRRGTTRCTRSPPRSRRRWPPAAPSCSSRARSPRSTPSCWPRSCEAVGPAARRVQPRHRHRAGGGRGARGAPRRRHGLASPARPAPAGASASWRPQTVKPVALELGGKSANVILDDADLAVAVTDGVAKCFLNTGQTCIALTRMLVPRERLAEAEAIAAAVAARRHAVGDPFDPATRARPAGVRACSATASAATSAGGLEEARALVTGGAEPPEGLDARLLRAAHRLRRRRAAT